MVTILPTSDPQSLFVWTWLPGSTVPVVAGRLIERFRRLDFVYGSTYLSRPDAISLFAPELPLKPGPITPLAGLDLPGCIRDGSPDAWGRRVIETRTGIDPDWTPEMRYLMESGSNRFGALDFQLRPDVYQPRDTTATLDDLQEAATLIDAGVRLPAALDAALLHGTSIGGARPKTVLVDDVGQHWIAKFASTGDRHFGVPQAEGTAMLLARRAGVSVCDIRVVRSLGKEVLLVRRFDRTDGGGRLHTVSALTMAGESETAARYVTYPRVLDVLLQYSQDPGAVGPELFRRIAFNIAVSNSDDHARNHAAIWDGRYLRLSPAYDLCPGPRSGHTAAQAMAFDRAGSRQSTFAALVRAAPVYSLTAARAREIVDQVVATIRDDFQDLADQARMPALDRETMFGRHFLNPGAFEDWPSLHAVDLHPGRAVTQASAICGQPRLRDQEPCQRKGRCPYHPYHG